MSDDELLQLWRRELTRPVHGWDFSELEGRMHTDEPPWSYDALARSVLEGAASALDMGTGGGEVLSGLADALPADAVATEGWEPNIPVAAAALEPLGIRVVRYDAEQDARMPFSDARFDTVLNRHEAYVASEVFRVLRPGGRFLTQQVDGRDFAHVPWEVPNDFDVDRYAEQLLALHRQTSNGRPLAFTRRRFFFVARRP